MREKYPTKELLKKTIEFYYPPMARSGKHFLIRELIIRRTLAHFQEQIDFIEDDFKKFITMPPGDESFTQHTPVIHNKLYRRLYPYFAQYLDSFARSLIDYPASHNLKGLILFLYISKYADDIQAYVVNQYYSDYYNNTRYRSSAAEQVEMSKILSVLLLGDRSDKEDNIDKQGYLHSEVGSQV